MAFSSHTVGAVLFEILWSRAVLYLTADTIWWLRAILYLTALILILINTLANLVDLRIRHHGFILVQVHVHVDGLRLISSWCFDSG